MQLTPETREHHHDWLIQLTQIPTAAGREGRVIEWIRRWVADRKDLALVEDPAGNLDVRFAQESGRAPPVYFTAHLDHPAFVVERIIAPSTVQLAFRGGVMDDYFESARVIVHAGDGRKHPGTLRGRADAPTPHFKSYLCELDEEAPGLRIGDIATWELPEARIEAGILYSHACDDLAALAASLGAFDVLREQRRERPESVPQDVRLLFTRAEEIGFIGAIAAVREGTLPKDAKVIALEVSRAFDDSPIGGGPIVRVGDRLSVFCPSLTAAVAKRAEDIAGGPSTVTAAQKLCDRPAWKWQRKLMPGGACEATVFCSAGLDATCLCLPLGNYHNMADLAAVQAGTNTERPRVGPEFIAISDFDGLVDLLIACGQQIPESPSIRERIDRLWEERAFVLKE
jgi:putative aminopeptidase FrvX